MHGRKLEVEAKRVGRVDGISVRGGLVRVKEFREVR
jgi:hypothetical protein